LIILISDSKTPSKVVNPETRERKGGKGEGKKINTLYQDVTGPREERPIHIPESLIK